MILIAICRKFLLLAYARPQSSHCEPGLYQWHPCGSFVPQFAPWPSGVLWMAADATALLCGLTPPLPVVRILYSCVHCILSQVTVQWWLWVSERDHTQSLFPLRSRLKRDASSPPPSFLNKWNNRLDSTSCKMPSHSKCPDFLIPTALKLKLHFSFHLVSVEQQKSQ